MQMYQSFLFIQRPTYLLFLILYDKHPIAATKDLTQLTIHDALQPSETNQEAKNLCLS